MCKYGCCNTFGESSSCEPGLAKVTFLNTCPYCDFPVYDADEKVRRGKLGYAHYECWMASGDGA